MLKTENSNIYMWLSVIYVIFVIYIKVIYRLGDINNFQSSLSVENWWQTAINLNILKSMPDTLSLYSQGPVFFKNFLFMIPLGFFLKGFRANSKIFWIVSILTVIGSELAQYILIIGAFDIGTVAVMILGCLVGSKCFVIFSSKSQRM